MADDDKTNTNGDGDDGGGDKGNAGDGGDKTADTGSITLTIAGEERTMTLDEVKALASKSGGADARFREAATMREESVEASKFYDTWKRSNEGDEAALRELSTLMGEDPDKVEDFLNEYQKTQNGEGDADDDKKTTPAAKAALTPAQEEAIAMGKNAALERTREKTLTEMKNFLDKDSIIGEDKIKSPDARKSLGEIFEAEVVSRLARNERYGPELLTAALQKVRTLVQKLGIRDAGGETDKDETLEDKAKRLQVGLGPSDSKTSEAVQANKPIPRVPITDPGYADNFVARALLNKPPE